MPKINKDLLSLKLIDIIFFSIILCSNYYYYAFIDRHFHVNFNIKLVEISFLFVGALFFFFISSTILNFFKNHYFFQKLLIILFLSWMVNMCIQTFFFMSNEITFSFFITKIFNIYPSGNYELLIRISRFILPYVFFIVILFFFYNYKKKIIKFIKILSIFFFFFIILNEIQLASKFVNKDIEKNYIKYERNKTNLKVLWILFDEFDPLIADDHIDMLPNYKEFRDKSFQHKQMYMAAQQTNISVPAQLMGIPSRGALVKNGKYYIINNENKPVEFNYDNTIFGLLEKKGINSSIYSSFFPYCKIYFKDKKLSNCIDPEFDNRSLSLILNRSYKENFKGLFFIFSPASKIIMTLNLIEKDKSKNNINLEISKEDLQIISNSVLDQKFLNDLDGYKLIYFEQIKKFLDSKHSQFSFFHTNIPHLPSKFAEKKLNLDSYALNKNEMIKYLINLKYTDFVIKNIQNIVTEKKIDNTIIIFSSDHWFRIKDLENNKKNKVYPSLFLVNFLGDNKQSVYLKKSSGDHFKDLILKIFDGKVLDQKDIVEYYELKDFNSPCLLTVCVEGKNLKRTR